MRVIKIAVLYGHGINCDYETEHVIEKASRIRNISAEVERVHTNHLLSAKRNLEDYGMLVIPGGFSYGDDLGAGRLLALKLAGISDKIEEFISEGKLIMGICNGFQVLVRYPLLPSRGEQTVTLTWNESGRYEDRWVWLKTEKSKCIFLRDIELLYLPIRHAEGRFFAENHTLRALEKNNQIALKYVKPNGSPANQEFPYNPNGSMEDIAGICDPSGRIFGLMPHPEAFHSRYNHPWWGSKENLDEVTGLKIFENALTYLSEEL